MLREDSRLRRRRCSGASISGPQHSFGAGHLEWECDSKHIDSFLEKLADFGSRGAWPGAQGAELKRGKTPGVKKVSDDDVRVPLGPFAAKSYWGLVALANFMAQDRPDISFASNEVLETMSSPVECDIGPLKRLVRYLSLHPRSVSCLGWQEAPVHIDAFSDSDWGGDLVTPRSIRGDCLLRVSHRLEHWSRAWR